MRKHCKDAGVVSIRGANTPLLDHRGSVLEKAMAERELTFGEAIREALGSSAPSQPPPNARIDSWEGKVPTGHLGDVHPYDGSICQKSRAHGDGRGLREKQSWLRES